jgi:exopolyphosphatase/guanosine-5'-triphosphate,3'-diphosphate pyrophosphatase
MPGLQPARADIIVAGVQILLEVMNGLTMNEIQVSEADLMYGLALETVEAVETK